MRASAWPREHVSRLRVLVRRKRSASSCAVSLNRQFEGAAYTRNAVIGKCHRLGLSLAKQNVGAAAKIVVDLEPARHDEAQP